MEINLDSYHILRPFSLKFLEILFDYYLSIEKIAEKNSYSLYENKFSDGSGSIIFDSPTDFTEDQSKGIINNICNFISGLEVETLQHIYTYPERKKNKC